MDGTDQQGSVHRGREGVGHLAQEELEADRGRVRQGDLVHLGQAGPGPLLVEYVILLGVVGHRVAPVGPLDVELHVVLVERVGPDLHHHWLASSQDLFHILHIKIIQVVGNFDILNSIMMSEKYFHC